MKTNKIILGISLFMVFITIKAQVWTQTGNSIYGVPGDELGSSVSINSDGSIVAIGAPGNGSDLGHVYIYQNVNNVWTQIGNEIQASSQHDCTGISVSLSADGLTLAMAITRYLGNFNSDYQVRIYKYTNGSWIQTGTFPGYRSVNLNSDGSILAIGNTDAGIISVYQNINGTWTQIGSDISGESTDLFGYSVSLSADGSTVAAGAPYNSENSYHSGYVRVYENNNGTWIQIGSDINGETTGESGWSVSLSNDGSTVAIGAPFNNVNGSASGSVRVFLNNNGTWMQLGQNINGEADEDRFGWSVSLSGDGSTIAIGANLNDGNGSNSGHARVFKNVNGVWTQVGSDIDGEAADDQCGTSVSLNDDGSILAVGSPLFDSSGYNYSGEVRIFELLYPPVITNQPSDIINVCPGSNVSFSITGNYIDNYQWQESTDNGDTWSDISNSGVYSGTTSSTLNITGVTLAMNTHQYRCVVSNSDGTDISEVATLTTENVPPDIPSLPVLTDECSVTATPPTTTDNCAGMVTGTTTDPLTYTQQGTYTIHWVFDDGNGNVSTTDQSVIIDDTTPPDIPSLPVLTDECSVTATPPTTTDNCAGMVTGTTTDPLTYTQQGTYTIHWVFDDGNGNVSTTDQSVIIDDTTPPDIPSLPVLTDECSVTATPPTTTDNCAGMVTGTTTDPLTYTQQGTYTIHWVFDDGNGNVSTTDQSVIIDDTTPPDIPSLPVLTDECSVTATPPTTTDNCAGMVTGTTTDPLTYTQQGTYTIHWVFDDGNGNVSTTDQSVIIDDTTPPVITCVGNQTVNADQTHTYTVSGTEFDPVSANDNCTVSSIYNDFNSASTLADTSLPEGTMTITWHIIDEAGNESTCSFEVIINTYVSTETLQQKGISIYPNPVSNSLIIDFSSLTGQETVKSIKISDISGKMIQCYTVNNKVFKIDLSNLKNAVYFIQIETDRSYYMSKIVKE